MNQTWSESKFWTPSGSFSCFSKNLELKLLFDSCSASWNSWNGLFKPLKYWFIHKTDLQLLLRFFDKIATVNPLRFRRKTLNAGSDSTPALFVDHLCYEQIGIEDIGRNRWGKDEVAVDRDVGGLILSCCTRNPYGHERILKEEAVCTCLFLHIKFFIYNLAWNWVIQLIAINKFLVFARPNFRGLKLQQLV